MQDTYHFIEFDTESNQALKPRGSVVISYYKCIADSFNGGDFMGACRALKESLVAKYDEGKVLGADELSKMKKMEVSEGYRTFFAKEGEEFEEEVGFDIDLEIAKLDAAIDEVMSKEEGLSIDFDIDVDFLNELGLDDVKVDFDIDLEIENLDSTLSELFSGDFKLSVKEGDDNISIKVDVDQVDETEAGDIQLSVVESDFDENDLNVTETLSFKIIEDPDKELEAALKSVEGKLKDPIKKKKKSKKVKKSKKKKSSVAIQEALQDFEEILVNHDTQETELLASEKPIANISKDERIAQIDNWLSQSSNSIATYLGCTTLGISMGCSDGKCENLRSAALNQDKAETCYKLYREKLASCKLGDSECLINYHSLHQDCHNYAEKAFNELYSSGSVYSVMKRY